MSGILNTDYIDRMASQGFVVVRNRPELEDCLHIPVETFHALRTAIIQNLLTLYDRVECTDPDWKHHEFIVVGHKVNHSCTSTFNAKEWLGYYNDELFTEKMEKHLEWCKYNWDRVHKGNLRHDQFIAWHNSVSKDKLKSIY